MSNLSFSGWCSLVVIGGISCVIIDSIRKNAYYFSIKDSGTAKEMNDGVMSRPLRFKSNFALTQNNIQLIISYFMRIHNDMINNKDVIKLICLFIEYGDKRIKFWKKYILSYYNINKGGKQIQFEWRPAGIAQCNYVHYQTLKLNIDGTYQYEIERWVPAGILQWRPDDDKSEGVWDFDDKTNLIQLNGIIVWSDNTKKYIVATVDIKKYISAKEMNFENIQYRDA